MTTTYGYNERHQVTAVAHAKAGVTTLPRYEYTRRADGKISQGKEYTNTAVLQRTLDYLYDELGRMKEERHTPDGSATQVTQYVLDLVGNRLQKVAPAGTTTWSYDARDWIIDEVFGAQTTQYGWDANGALSCKSAQANCQTPGATYEYDLEGRLSRATVGPTVKTYRYNDHGLRIREEVTGPGAGITQFVVDGSNPTGYAQVAEERGTDGALRASYDYGLEPLSQWQNGAVTHYLMDAHSGVRALTTATGVLTDTYRYDAFGVQVPGAETLVNPLRYRGERFDAVASQYYLRARTYDLSASRFTNIDPYAGDRNVPVTLHRYIYAGADPVNHTDPSGLMFGFVGGFSIGNLLRASFYGAIFGAAGGFLVGTTDALLGGAS